MGDKIKSEQSDGLLMSLVFKVIAILPVGNTYPHEFHIKVNNMKFEYNINQNPFYALKYRKTLQLKLVWNPNISSSFNIFQHFRLY